jgi:putative SOS response-associated peptidase YedK
MKDVHNRMPCILSPEDEDTWLNPDSDEQQLLTLLSPFPDTAMKGWAISSLVNKASNNAPEILTPVRERG